MGYKHLTREQRYTIEALLHRSLEKSDQKVTKFGELQKEDLARALVVLQKALEAYPGRQ